MGVILISSVMGTSGVSFAVLVMGAAGVRRRSSHGCHWCLGSAIFLGLLGSRIPLLPWVPLAVNVTDAAGFSVTTHVLGSWSKCHEKFILTLLSLFHGCHWCLMSHLPGVCSSFCKCHGCHWGLVAALALCAEAAWCQGCLCFLGCHSVPGAACVSGGCSCLGCHVCHSITVWLVPLVPLLLNATGGTGATLALGATLP